MKRKPDPQITNPRYAIKMPNFPRLDAAYNFIRDYTWQNGYAPTVLEIAQELHCGKTMAHYYLRMLEAQGRVRRRYHKSRLTRLRDEDDV